MLHLWIACQVTVMLFNDNIIPMLPIFIYTGTNMIQSTTSKLTTESPTSLIYRKRCPSSFPSTRLMGSCCLPFLQYETLLHGDRLNRAFGANLVAVDFLNLEAGSLEDPFRAPRSAPTWHQGRTPAGPSKRVTGHTVPSPDGQDDLIDQQARVAWLHDRLQLLEYPDAVVVVSVM